MARIVNNIKNQDSSKMVSSTIFGSVKNEGTAKSGEIWLNGFVGDEWSDTGISMKNLKNYVDTNGLTKCTMYLNTGGGYVWAAMEIAAYMQMNKSVTFKVVNTGIVASAGVIILVTADKSEAVDGSVTMIHNPTVDGYGSYTAKDLKSKINVLNTLKDSMVGMYINKMKKMGVANSDNEEVTKEALNTMMDDETWMTATEAKSLGLVNNVIEGGKVKKDIVSNALNLNICNSLNYKNMSKVQEWLDKLSGKTNPTTKNEVVDENITNALQILKNAGYAVEGDEDVEVIEVDEVTAAMELLKGKGFKVVENATKTEAGKSPDKKVATVDKTVEPTNDFNERMSKMEELIAIIAQNSIKDDNGKENVKRVVKNTTMPIIKIGKHSSDEMEESDDDGKAVNVFSKIKNGKALETAMEGIATAIKG